VAVGFAICQHPHFRFVLKTDVSAREKLSSEKLIFCVVTTSMYVLVNVTADASSPISGIAECDC
jgi:hypothetical protein